MPDAAPAMLRITSRADAGVAPSDRVRLTYEERTRTRLLARLDSGLEVAIDLARGSVLKAGDCLLASDGRIVEVCPALETLLHVAVEDPLTLARAAYHLGNRHVAVELRPGALRVGDDGVLERLLRGLDLKPMRIEAPFAPEGGAYGHSHTHLGDTSRLAPVIHEYRRT